MGLPPTSPDFRMTRRRMLERSALGFGWLAASALLSDSGRASEPVGPLAVRKPHFTPRAKRVIFLFMKGGPSQVDTFDPKPLLDRDDGKPYPGQKPRVQFAPTSELLKSPWKFRQYGQSGLPVSELFPLVA